jgi:UbiD family decarboxylase
VPFRDIRDFLDALRKQGELIDIDRPVTPHLEVADVPGSQTCDFPELRSRSPS